MRERKQVEMTAALAPGTAVLVHGSAATVTSAHKGGKRYGVTYSDGKQTFVNASACKPARKDS